MGAFACLHVFHVYVRTYVHTYVPTFYIHMCTYICVVVSSKLLSGCGTACVVYTWSVIAICNTCTHAIMQCPHTYHSRMLVYQTLYVSLAYIQLVIQYSVDVHIIVHTCITYTLYMYIHTVNVLMHITYMHLLCM